MYIIYIEESKSFRPIFFSTTTTEITNHLRILLLLSQPLVHLLHGQVLPEHGLLQLPVLTGQVLKLPELDRVLCQLLLQKDILKVLSVEEISLQKQFR